MSESRHGPNLIGFLTDDQGYADLSCMGADCRTPHLDRLAADGVNFTGQEADVR